MAIVSSYGVRQSYASSCYRRSQLVLCASERTRRRVKSRFVIIGGKCTVFRGDLQRRILSAVPRPRSVASVHALWKKKASGIVQRRVDIVDRLIKLQGDTTLGRDTVGCVKLVSAYLANKHLIYSWSSKNSQLRSKYEVTKKK